jgi:hypothetical protein
MADNQKLTVQTFQASNGKYLSIEVFYKGDKNTWVDGQPGI